ncbi:MAG: tRNA (adenosine(37)-N6)-threonylcarbamoyltransferase complex dimerization subunit type 1 TsaB [Gemmatimonadetes bacterium]|nr:MAG: tRNA (adenosine(37)-N6)-threonylcarbamoyltransferase complex dimerization subunit type 1 TsaB [Gemmatimonadota bacterium]
MKILAIDTSTSRAGVALVQPTTVDALCQLEFGNRHGEHLLDLIDFVLSSAGQSITGVDGFAVVTGPGSFTGLRIGISVVKGLAFAAQKPVVTATSLEVIATIAAYQSTPVCPMLNARRKEVYTALYDCTGALPQPLSEVTVIAPEQWLEQLAAQREPILFCGDGAIHYANQIDAILGDNGMVLPLHLQHGCASGLGYIGLQKLEQGNIEDLHTFEPLYIRPPDAKLPGVSPVFTARTRQ